MALNITFARSSELVLLASRLVENTRELVHANRAGKGYEFNQLELGKSCFGVCILGLLSIFRPRHRLRHRANFIDQG